MNVAALNCPCSFINVGYLAGQLSEVYLESYQTSTFLWKQLTAKSSRLFSQKSSTIDALWVLKMPLNFFRWTTASAITIEWVQFWKSDKTLTNYWFCGHKVLGHHLLFHCLSVFDHFVGLAVNALAELETLN